MIPIFRGTGGKGTVGHFFLIIIVIANKKLEGHVFDSLGKKAGSNNDEQINKLTELFSTRRRRINWKIWDCEKQVEYECGARTIIAMATMILGIQNNISVDEIFFTISMISTTTSSYCSTQIRNNALAILQDSPNWHNMNHIPEHWNLQHPSLCLPQEGATNQKRKLTHRDRFKKKKRKK